MKSKPETPAFVAVSVFQDAKDFEVTNDMLNRDATASEFTLSFSCFFAEGLFGWFTLGCLTVSMKVLESLIASVTQDFTKFVELNPTPFEEFEVMLTTFADQDIKNLLALSKYGVFSCLREAFSQR